MLMMLIPSDPQVTVNQEKANLEPYRVSTNEKL